MDKQIYHDLARAGEYYWWNRGRQYLVTRLFRKYCPPAAGKKTLQILDIGCAAGGTLFYLSRWGDVWGLDISPEAIALCQSWGIKPDRLVLGNAENMSAFKLSQFDLVTAVEILEHVEHPLQALEEIRRILQPGGILLLTVPADMRLWSERDVRLEHKRRYTLLALEQSIRDAGLEVLKTSYANAFYYWPLRLILWWQKRNTRQAVAPIKTNTYDVNPILNWIFTVLLKIEVQAILRASLPWGVSAVCVARKPEADRNRN